MKCQGTIRDEPGETSRGLITNKCVHHPKEFGYHAVGNSKSLKYFREISRARAAFWKDHTQYTD